MRRTTARCRPGAAPNITGSSARVGTGPILCALADLSVTPTVRRCTACGIRASEAKSRLGRGADPDRPSGVAQAAGRMGVRPPVQAPGPTPAGLAAPARRRLATVAGTAVRGAAAPPMSGFDQGCGHAGRRTVPSGPPGLTTTGLEALSTQGAPATGRDVDRGPMCLPRPKRIPAPQADAGGACGACGRRGWVVAGRDPGCAGARPGLNGGRRAGYGI